jgi:hypothetical protein
MISKTCFESVPERVPSAIRPRSCAPWAGLTGLSSICLAEAVEGAEQIADHPVRGLAGEVLSRKGREQLLEPARGLDFSCEHRGIVGRKAQHRLIAAALGIRKLGQAGAAFLEEGVLELQRQQVGIGEIAIIVRVFLGAERARLGFVGVEKAGLLDDRAAAFEYVHLAVRFIFDRGHDEPHRIDVLGLGRVPKGATSCPSRAGRRTDTLTSARIEPCSILPSHEPT